MRLIAPLIGTLLLVGFVLKYWVLIALVLTAVAVWKYGPGWWARHQATAAAQRRRLAAIAARADQQHQWTLVGDPRGTYGHLSWRIQAVLLHTQCVQGVRRRGAETSFSAGSNGRPSPQGRPSRRR